MKRILLFALVLGLTTLGFAEKFGFVSSAVIMTKYSEAVKIQKDLQQFTQGKQQEIMNKEAELKKLDEELKNLSPIISKEVKQKKFDDFQAKMQAYMQFKEQSQMELQRKQMEALRPIEQKINKAIQTVSEREGFDFVYDSNTGTLLYAKAKYDITDLVLTELEKK